MLMSSAPRRWISASAQTETSYSSTSRYRPTPSRCHPAPHLLFSSVFLETSLSSHPPAPFLPSQPCVPLCVSLSFPFCSVSHPLPLSLFQIPQAQARICFLHLRRVPEVQLMVQSSWLRDSLSRQTDMQGVDLLFSSRRGHLFLQTDQPVYNPGQRGELAPGPPPFMPSQPLE